MIITESFEPWEIVNLLNSLNNALSAEKLYKVDIIYNVETREFSVGHWSLPKCSFVPATIEEERAFVAGGCHATPSECSL